MKERWKDIPGYEGYYQVSNKGNVRSLTRSIKHRKGYMTTLKGKLMKFHECEGYYVVNLSKDGTKKSYYVHRLVLITFGKPIEGKNITNHIDGNKHKNHINNLEWCTIKENNDHAIRHNLRSDNLELFIPYRESRKRNMIAYDDNWCPICRAKGPKRLGEMLQFMGYFRDIKIEDLSSRLSHAALKGRTYHKLHIIYE